MKQQPRFPPGFWPIWSTVALDLLGFGIIIPLLPLYAKEFGATPFHVGLLLATYSLGQFVMSPVWGRLSDRVGRKPILMVTVAGSCIGSLVLGLAGSLPLLFLGRAIDGISGASVAVARATVADVATPDRRARLMGLLGAAFGLGFVIGPAVGSVAARFGSSAPFLLAAGLAFANLVSIIIRVKETRAVVTARSRGLDRRSVSHPVRRLALLTLVAVGAFSAFEATFSLLAEERLGIDQTTIGFVFAAVGILLVVTQGVLVGPAAVRFGETDLIRIGLFLNVAGFGVIAVATTWTVLVPGLLTLALGQGLITPALSSSVAQHADPDAVGAALGVQESAGGLARVVGPILGGLLFGMTSWAPYAVAAGLTMVAIPMTRVGRR